MTRDKTSNTKGILNNTFNQGSDPLPQRGPINMAKLDLWVHHMFSRIMNLRNLNFFHEICRLLWSVLKVAFFQKVQCVFQISKKIYSKKLSWTWNLNFKLRIVFWKIFLEIWRKIKKTNRTFWKKATFSGGIYTRLFQIEKLYEQIHQLAISWLF